MSLNINSKSIISLILCILIIVTPFITLSFGKSPFEFPKFIFTLIIAQILALLLIFKNFSLTKNKIILSISLFVLVNFVSNMLGLDPRVSLLGGEYRFQGFLLLISSFILVLSTSFKINKTLIYNSIILSSILLSALTVAQFLLLKNGYFLSSYNGRVIATLGNPNFIGAYVAMALPLVLTLNLKNTLLKLFFILLLIISVLISLSLSAILATTVILTIYVFNNLRKYGRGKQIIPAILLVILIALTIFSFKDSVYRYSQWDNRFIIWGQGIKSAINKPLLGVGQENFELIVPTEMFYKVDNAHNVFLETAVSSGLIGLFSFLAIIYQGLNKARYNEKLSILAFLIAGFFNPLPIICINVFWILIGLSAANKEN
jgi:O-antigen ligase